MFMPFSGTHTCTDIRRCELERSPCTGYSLTLSVSKHQCKMEPNESTTNSIGTKQAISKDEKTSHNKQATKQLTRN